MEGDGDSVNDRDLELLAPTNMLTLLPVDEGLGCACGESCFCCWDASSGLFAVPAPLTGCAEGSNEVWNFETNCCIGV